MRALDRLSASSLTITVPSPWKGEPSRRMTRSSRCCGLVLEIAAIDRLQARLVDRELSQASVCGDDGGGRVRPHGAVRRHAEAIRAQCLDIGYPGYSRKPPRESGALSFDFNNE